MTDVESRTVTITRVLDAPRERVWRVWTEPEELARWWWPERFGTTYEVDLREGGGFRFRTVDVPGMGVVCVGGEFVEVRPMERLVYTWQWEGGEDVTRVTVEFVDLGARTELHITHEGFTSEEERESHGIGWSDCLKRLEELKELAL